MRENVYFIEASDNERDDILCDKLKNLIEAEDLLAAAETDTSLAAVAVYKSLGGGWEPFVTAK